MNKETTLSNDESHKIHFGVEGPNGETETLIELSQKGFFYKGERIDDIHDVYSRLNEWMNRMEHGRK